jgi:hypothetical protein
MTITYDEPVCRRFGLDFIFRVEGSLVGGAGLLAASAGLPKTATPQIDTWV